MDVIKIRNKDHTRRRILTIAKKSFLENGYRDTYISKIADAAKIDRRTIYRYFDTKEQLLLQITWESYTNFTAYLSDTDFVTQENAYQRIITLFQRYNSYFKENNELLVFAPILDNKLSAKDRIKDNYLNYLTIVKIPDAILKNLLAEGLLDQSINPQIKPEIAALSINNSLFSLASRIVLDKEFLDKEQEIDSWLMLEQLSQLLLDGLKK